MAGLLDSVTDPVPRTPVINEIRSDNGSENLRFATEMGGTPVPGIRRVNLRAEIDTNPPFGSVKEAVTRFGGSGPWIPYWKFADTCNGDEEFDIKRVEEQTTELEKDLIVKELETLDVLEELSTTKKMVEELKRQLKNEALKCFTAPTNRIHSDEHVLSPHIKEMNQESYNVLPNNTHRISSPCPVSSPEMILMELKQAKLNLGKTINDLGIIQTSVESLNKKMRKEKILLEQKSQENKESLEKTIEIPIELLQQLIPNVGKIKNMNVNVKHEISKMGLRTAELRWVAAKKMEEAAKAIESVALSEIEALKNSEISSEFSLNEPEKISFNFKDQSFLSPKTEGFSKNNLEHSMLEYEDHGQAKTPKLSIVDKLREAKEEVSFSKQALEEAMSRVELASKKQLDVEEALRKLIPENDQSKQSVFYPRARTDNSERSNMTNNDPKPLTRRPTLSMRDVLSKKQVNAPETYAKRKDGETQKVALSEMLQALREDLSFPSRTEKDGNDHRKPDLAERKRFGFIHISLPLTKQSKKKVQALNTM